MNIIVQLYLWLMTMFGIPASTVGPYDTVQTGDRQTMNAKANTQQEQKRKAICAIPRTGKRSTKT